MRFTFSVLFRMEDLPDPLANTLHGGTGYDRQHLPNRVGRDLRHGGCTVATVVCPTPMLSPVNPWRPRSLARMLELAVDRLQDFTGTQQAFVFPRLLALRLDELQ